MRQKSEVFSHFQNFKNEVEKATSWHVRCLRSDRGKDYLSDSFTTYLWQEGIWREFTCQHTPQQNRVTEWKNWHILEVTPAMMNEKNLLKSYWAEAVNTVVYLMNQCTTSGVHDIPRQDIQLDRICTYSRWKAAKAQSEIGEAYPCGVLTRTKGV